VKALSTRHWSDWAGTLAFTALGVALLVGGWYVAQVIVLDHSAAAAVTASVKDQSAPLRPDDSVQVTARGAGVALEDVQLFRAEVAGDGSRSGEQPVAVRLQATADPTVWQLVPEAGQSLLAPDGAYRLGVHATAPRPALPGPRVEALEEQYRFTTVASPHAALPSGTLQPRWAEPVSFTWSEPMQTVSAAVTPAAPLATWIDAADPHKMWVRIGGSDGGGLTDGQTYEVRVAQAAARDGIALQTPVTFTVVTPRLPRFVDPPTDTVTLRYGESYTLETSMEIVGAQVSTSEDAPAEVTMEKSAVRVDMPDFQQGVDFDVSVMSATSAQGAPLAEPVTLHFATPPAFEAPTIAPRDGAQGVQPTQRPSITFPEPVADQDATLDLLQVEPAVAGHWTWTSPVRAEFVPNSRLPYLSDITIRVLGGPDGARNEDGGYLEDDVAATFRTTDFKRIDVSLGRQSMTLFEYDRPVRTIAVATGVALAPTPTGTFAVQYKSAQMRFRGVNPDGSHYDIPDVHWVLPFWGDYTIHGAYWRPQFGVPGSDGCVSMTDADAKLVYDWASVGTPITIYQ